MLYKSKTIEFLPKNAPLKKLCVYGDYYYYESFNEIPEAEIVSQEEFDEAVNSIVHVDGAVKPGPQETQLDRIENAVNDIAKNNTSYTEMASAIAKGVNDIE